ncbi:hypothetical protein KBB12_04425 [Candidatus Woesebacteria bacterium]|nr:hypothetical protein [Candidatus Woesebacteria bacterium]
MTEVDQQPDVFRGIEKHVADYSEATGVHGTPMIRAAKREGLNLGIEFIAAQQAEPNYSLIYDEMQALGPVTEICIDDSHSFVIGSTSALDPHTYLKLPAQQVVQAYRNRYLEGMSSEAITDLRLPDSGLPTHITPLDEKKQTFLPLHFVNWCLLKDTTSGEATYRPLDALSFYASGKTKLESMGCEVATADAAMRQAHQKMAELSLRNREVVAELYNRHLLPDVIKAIKGIRQPDGPDGSPGALRYADLDEGKLDGLLRCDPQNQRVYCNIGHSSRGEQEEFDTGRGPATLEPWHDFTRYIPIKKFAQLAGRFDTTSLTREDYGEFLDIIRAVSSVIPGLANGEFIQQIRLEELGNEQLPQLIKMLDTYSDYLGTYSLPVLDSVLRKCLSESGDDIQIKVNEHMAGSTSLVASHGKSIVITITPTQTQQEYDSTDDVAFGIAMMDRLYDPLQDFFHLYNQTYQQVFDLATKVDLTEEGIRNIFNTNLQGYNGYIKEGDLTNLAKALAQLKPTAKMEDSRAGGTIGGETVEDDGKSRNDHIRRNDLVLGILQMLVNNPEVQHEVETKLKGASFTGVNLRNFFEEKSITIPTRIPEDSVNYDRRENEVWETALADIRKNCFDDIPEGASLSQRILTRMVTAVAGLERRGLRTGARSENIPRIPGLLMSYRVGRVYQDLSTTDRFVPMRQFELELGIASGQRGALEITSGGIVSRQADM